MRLAICQRTTASTAAMIAIASGLWIKEVRAGAKAIKLKALVV
jgi:hypothetical protein